MLAEYGIPFWAEWIIIAAFILLGTLAAAVLVRFLLGSVARRIAERTANELDDILVRTLARPLFYLVLIGGLDAELRYLAHVHPAVSPEVFLFLHSIKFTLGAIVAGWLIIRLAGSTATWYGRNVARRTETHIDDEFVPIVDRTIKTVVVVLVFMAILSHFHVDIKGLVAVLGVASLAVALAAQDTLANMIAGFILMLDRPFRIGDRIVLPDQRRVDVYEIGLRSTKFMTFDHTLVIIPNAEISKMTITNLSYPAPRIRIRVDVGVAYGSDIDKVKGLLIDAARGNPKVVSDPAPNAHLVRFGDSSLDFSLYAFVPQYQDEWTTANEIREAVNKLFERERIVIPFPQRTIHLTSSQSSEQQTST